MSVCTIFILILFSITFPHKANYFISLVNILNFSAVCSTLTIVKYVAFFILIPYLLFLLILFCLWNFNLHLFKHQIEICYLKTMLIHAYFLHFCIFQSLIIHLLSHLTNFLAIF